VRAYSSKVEHRAFNLVVLGSSPNALKIGEILHDWMWQRRTHPFYRIGRKRGLLGVLAPPSAGTLFLNCVIKKVTIKNFTTKAGVVAVTTVAVTSLLFCYWEE
jgi:hypothetical protein